VQLELLANCTARDETPKMSNVLTQQTDEAPHLAATAPQALAVYVSSMEMLTSCADFGRACE
jgi:hypothetical protein